MAPREGQGALRTVGLPTRDAPVQKGLRTHNYA